MIPHKLRCVTLVSSLLWVVTACDTLYGPQPQGQNSRPAATQSTSSPKFNPAKYEKLAVIVQDLTGRRAYDAALVRQVEDVFAQELFSKGYRLATRSDIESVMKEITLQTSGLTDSDASRVGRLLNVPAVLIVGITGREADREQQRNVGLLDLLAMSNSAKISARLVEVESAEWLWIASDSGASVVSVARKIAGTFPTRGQ